jgi:thiamine-phosphate pyrophosphorylase
MTILERFTKSRLYAITCAPRQGAIGYVAMAEAACRGGADILQFRDKALSGRERFAAATAMKTICRRSGVLFIVNDDLALGLAVGADGVHLGQDDLPMPAARQVVNQSNAANFLIGRSTHSLEQALAAEREGADYIGIGPVFSTPTKPTYGAVGLELVRTVAAQVKVPHVAIGGIDAANVGDVLKAGAERVAVVRAVCGADDIEAACRRMKDAVQHAYAASGERRP